MRQSTLCLAVMSACLLVACVPVALNPFYTQQDLSFDPALLGDWGEKDNGAKVRFTKSGTDAYWMTDLEGDSMPVFEAHLFKINGSLFLDLYPESTGLEGSDLLKLHVLRAHTLIRVDQVTPALVTAGLNEEWLKDLLARDRAALPHIIADDRLIVTATTSELQAFVLKHLRDEGAFESPSEMVKMTK